MKKKSLVIEPKPLKGEDNFRVVSIRIRKELLQEVENISAKTGYSRNRLIGMFIEFALENCEV